MTTKTVFVTSGTSYTTPSDWGAPWSIEVIGGGAGSNTATSGLIGAAGAGAYSKITNSDRSIAASATVYVSVGAGGGALTNGGDTWANASSNAAPTLTSQGVLAKGGLYGTGSSGGAGGAAASGVGSTKTSGGAGGGNGGAGGLSLIHI